ncbi:MAG: bacteriohopanetetrol glucosamine biosynthesis glycosyltransferase HpnI [Elusimicrobia bacterium]|nr:bacteriohopanetetrol glucosamine biosynthesis glycosyltransferase HpnI [Elusimicrobiota bacterium]
MGWEIVGQALLAGRAVFSAFALCSGAFSLLFALATIALTRRYLSSRVRPGAAPLPPITLIKPLKGVDQDLYENLASFCRQDYPCFQILFCLSSPDDPALPVVSRLKRDFPDTDLEVVVSKSRIGYNPKVNNMANSYPFAKYDLLLMSDSDIRVERGFLRRMAAPFEDPAVGMTTSFYQASGVRGFWSHMESLSINANFLPQATTAAGIGMRFAMGAAMMVRRQAFDQTGGFANISDHLADDFWLGQSIREAGWRLEMAEGCVDSIPGMDSGVEHFKHLVRWARTIRLCQPAGFYASVIQHGFSLLIVRLLVQGPDVAGAALMAGIWAAKAAASISLDSRLGRRQPRLALWLLPLAECFSFAAWIGGSASNTVLWRGELFTVQSQGQLQPAAPPLVRRPLPVEP